MNSWMDDNGNLRSFQEEPRVLFYQVNGVPYPLDDYLRLKGQPTIKDVAELLKRWG